MTYTSKDVEDMTAELVIDIIQKLKTQHFDTYVQIIDELLFGE